MDIQDLVVQAGKMPMGSYPAILGHEGAGVVRRLGSGLKSSGLEVGDRVLLGYSSCLSCSACKQGRKGACGSIAMINVRHSYFQGRFYTARHLH
jgi:Zn-dependent alcohol dehydrogenase